MKTRISGLGLVLAASFLVLPGCVSYAKYAQTADALAAAQEELAYTQDRVAELEDALNDPAFAGVPPSEHEAVQAQLAALQAERNRLQGLVDELRANSGDLGGVLSVVHNAKEGMVGYSAAGDVLFASGSHELTSAGREALDIVVRKLQGIDAMVRVDGHTDSDPVVKTKDKYPEGNIQLGAMRAIAVREYLVQKGMPEDRVYIASYGPHRPTGPDKKRNRRVEIMVPVTALG